jgi:hypothetical protein
MVELYNAFVSWYFKEQLHDHLKVSLVVSKIYSIQKQKFYKQKKLWILLGLSLICKSWEYIDHTIVPYNTSIQDHHTVKLPNFPWSRIFMENLMSDILAETR